MACDRIPLRYLSASLAAFTVLLIGMAGCGGSDLPDTAPVTGEVTIDGQPLQTGSIRFFPANGRGAMGEIVDGRYALRTFAENDGALLGSHTVTITAVEVKTQGPKNLQIPPGMTPEQAEFMRQEEQVETTTWVVPQHYSLREQTPLTADVQPGENDIPFHISTKTR